MQSIRANLTRLRSQIESSLPEEGDLFEFPGITRGGLISLLQTAYAESYELLDKDDDFEVILLKRKLAQPMEASRDYLYDSKGGKKEKKYFDEFVRAVTEIRDQIRFTYLICNKSGLRTEEEIQRAKEALAEIQSSKDQLQQEVGELLAVRDELKSKLESVSEADAEAQGHLDTSQKSDASINSIHSKSGAAFEVITKYEQQITEAKESAVQNAAEITSIVGKGKKAITELDEAKIVLEKISGETKGLQNTCTTLNDEISKTLAAANRVGMAGSFHSRKEELRASLIIWGLCFVLSIGTILGIGVWLIFPYIGPTGLQMSLEDVGLKVIVVAPLVWLAWMSARQYGYTSRIREDYSYKYATAMAFEGYKKHAQEIDEELLQQLMRQAIEAVGQNPIRLYSAKDNHATPLQELADKVIDAVDARFGVRSDP